MPKKGVLIDFAKFTGKYISLSFSFNNDAGLRPVTLLKKGSETDVSCGFLGIFKSSFFYRKTSVAASTYSKTECD